MLPIFLMGFIPHVVIPFFIKPLQSWIIPVWVKIKNIPISKYSWVFLFGYSGMMAGWGCVHCTSLLHCSYFCFMDCSSSGIFFD